MDSEDDMHDANDVESVDDEFYSGEAEEAPMDYYCSEYDNIDEDVELEYEEDEDDDDDDANFDFVEDDADDSIDIESRRAEVVVQFFTHFLYANAMFWLFNSC